MESNQVSTVSFIGAGNVANHLAVNFHRKGVIINQIYNRSSESGIELCRKVGAHYISSLKELEVADILIIAVNDNAIKIISESIPQAVSNSTIIVHTSGSQSMDLLNSHYNYGSFYPLQSFRKKGQIDISVVPILISASDSKVQQRLFLLAETISQKATLISDKDRSLLHLPAVIVNNFTNHLLQLAYDYCEKNELDFSLLLPLINETVNRLTPLQAPKEMQTGPAMRGDKSTLARHENQLEAHPDILQLYKMITQNIEKYYE